MTRIRGIRNNFSGGIISKEVGGNVDIEQFNNSLEVCENMIKQATGGLSKRTGTLYLANFDNLNNDNYKLIPFPLSDTLAFVVRLEAGTPTETEDSGKKTVTLTTTVTAYLMDDQCKSFVKTNVNTTSVTYLSADTTFNIEEIDYTKVTYVQNRATLLVFIRDSILKITIDPPNDSNSEYQLSVIKQEYSFKPLSTAYTGTLYPVFVDNGKSTDDTLINYGFFANSQAFASLNEVSYKEYWNAQGTDDLSEGGLKCPAETFQQFCDGLETTASNTQELAFYYHVISEYKSSLPDSKSIVSNNKEVDELASALKPGTTIMLNYTSSDSDQPNLSWLIEIEDIKSLVNTTGGGSSLIPMILAFQYKFVDEYCPTTTITDTDTISDHSLEKTIRQDLPQVIKIDDTALRYLNTAQPSSFRFDLLADYNDSFVTAGVYENRLYLGGTDRNPNVIVASSRTYQDWLNFSTGSLAGDGLIENISSDYGVQLIKWLCGSSKLFIGTSDGVFIFGSNTLNDEAVTPANARAKQISSVPVGELQPLRGLDSVFFVDSSGKKIYEILYDEQQYAVNELSLLSRELYQSGIKSHAYMQIPQKLYWACMNDGTLISMSYLKNINSLSATQQVLGTYNTNLTETIDNEGYDFQNINNVSIKINNILSVNKGDLNLILIDVCRYLNGEVYSHTLEAFNYSLHKDPGNISRYYVDCGFELIRCATVTKINFEETSTITISTDEVPERFWNVNNEDYKADVWYPCFLTDLPEIPQINNKEIYLKYNSDNNWDFVQLVDGEYKEISIPSNLTNISVRGYCYFPFNYKELQARLDMCSHFENTKICLLTNHEYHYVTIEENCALNEDDKEILFHKDSDADNEYTKEYWYLAGGFNYAARMKTTPFYNMSFVVGASLGLINYQSEVVLQMYGCQTGYIGADFECMSLIPYKRKPTDIVNEDFLMNPQVELVHCHTFPGKDVYQQSVCIVDIKPVPLNILSITQDIEYSDQ